MGQRDRPPERDRKLTHRGSGLGLMAFREEESRGVAMSYFGDWTDDALNGLAAAWAAATDRTAVTQASHRLDLALIRHPFAIGLPRNSSVNRTAVELPLGVD